MKPSRGFFASLGSALGLAALLAAGLLPPATSLMAQKREDFIALQRDVAQLQDQIKQLQTDQNQKLAALQTLIQQALDASTKVNAGMASLQDNVRRSMTEEQQRTAAPLATMNNKVNQVSEDVGAIKENVADLGGRMSKLDSKLSDISTAVRTLSTPPPAPPSANGQASGPAVPAGITADSLFENANRDYTSGKDDLAMQEFTEYLQYFPKGPNAPDAMYYQGMIYDRAKPPQYEDALQAFDSVGERYPENPKSADALYMKGVELMKLKRNADAAVEFRNLIKTYPNHPTAARAQAHLREIAAAPSTARGKKK
jgi:TolA-binding protein